MADFYPKAPSNSPGIRQVWSNPGIFHYLFPAHGNIDFPAKYSTPQASDEILNSHNENFMEISPDIPLNSSHVWPGSSSALEVVWSKSFSPRLDLIPWRSFPTLRIPSSYHLFSTNSGSEEIMGILESSDKMPVTQGKTSKKAGNIPVEGYGWNVCAAGIWILKSFLAVLEALLRAGKAELRLRGFIF